MAMSSTLYKAMCWIAAVLLLALSAWSCNLAAFNWYAADFHDEYSRAHASRGNIFFFIALACLIASVTIIVVMVRRMKKPRPETDS